MKVNDSEQSLVGICPLKMSALLRHVLATAWSRRIFRIGSGKLCSVWNDFKAAQAN